MEEQKSEARCINCLYFDSRTGFCRYNPPQVILSKEGYYNSVFPRIALPLLDFCYKYSPMIKAQDNEVKSPKIICE